MDEFKAQRPAEGRGRGLDTTLHWALWRPLPSDLNTHLKENTDKRGTDRLRRLLKLRLMLTIHGDGYRKLASALPGHKQPEYLQAV